MATREKENELDGSESPPAIPFVLESDGSSSDEEVLPLETFDPGTPTEGKLL